MKPYGKVLSPYELKPPNLARMRDRLLIAWDEHFLVSAFFGVGWTANLSRAPRHSLPELAPAAFVPRRICRGR